MEIKDFLLTLPERINTNALAGMNTCFQFDMELDSGGQVTIHVQNGVMTTQEGLVGEPSCLIRAKASDLKLVFKGEINPLLAILTGKMKISNQTEMMKFGKILGWL